MMAEEDNNNNTPCSSRLHFTAVGCFQTRTTSGTECYDAPETHKKLVSEKTSRSELSFALLKIPKGS